MKKDDMFLQNEKYTIMEKVVIAISLFAIVFTLGLIAIIFTIVGGL